MIVVSIGTSMLLFRFRAVRVCFAIIIMVFLLLLLLYNNTYVYTEYMRLDRVRGHFENFATVLLFFDLSSR